jgi:hypothetical protein
MNKLIHTAPPSDLARWLIRSVTRTVACIAGFVPVGYWIGNINRDDKGSQLLIILVLALSQILVWRRAIVGFSQAFSNGLRPASWVLKVVALLCFWALLVLFAMATLFNGIGWLMLGDDGKNWSV